MSKEHSSDTELISASDIEKYGYCPLSWYLSFKQRENEVKVEEDPVLKKGEEAHISVGTDFSEIIKKQGEIRSTKISWIAFFAVAGLLALNGGLLLLLIIGGQDNELVSRTIAGISLLWIAVSLYYFISLLLTERKMKLPFLALTKFILSRPVKKPTTKKIYKRNVELFKWAVILAAIGGVLLSTAFIYTSDFDKLFVQNVLVIISLVWMFGTCVILFFTLKAEDTPPHRNQLLIGFTVVAFCLALNAFLVNRLEEFRAANTVTLIFVIIAVAWLFLSLFFLNISFSESFRLVINLKRIVKKKGLKPFLRGPQAADQMESQIKSHEKGVLYFALISLFLGLNSFLVGFNPRIEIAYIMEIISLIWLLGASFLLYVNLNTQQAMAQLMAAYKIDLKAKLEYVDDLRKKNKKPKLFKSRKRGLSGRPDLILKEEGYHIPVEYKSGRVPKGPYFSHILQLAAYGIIMEEEYGKRPPYGYIKYGPKDKQEQFKVELDDKLMDVVLFEKVEAIKKAIDDGEAHRNHNRPGKCRNCSRRKVCPEALA